MTLECPLAGHDRFQSSGSASRGLCLVLNIPSQRSFLLVSVPRVPLQPNQAARWSEALFFEVFQSAPYTESLTGTKMACEPCVTDLKGDIRRGGEGKMIIWPSLRGTRMSVTIPLTVALRNGN